MTMFRFHFSSAVAIALLAVTVITPLNAQESSSALSPEAVDSAKVEQWVRGYFTATQSGGASVWFDTFATNAVVEDPVGSPPLTTAEAILAQGEGFVNAFAKIGLYESFIHVNGLEAVAMWQGRGTLPDGTEVIFDGIDLFEFNEDGKITLLRGFWTPPG